MHVGLGNRRSGQPSKACRVCQTNTFIHKVGAFGTKALLMCIVSVVLSRKAWLANTKRATLSHLRALLALDRMVHVSMLQSHFDFFTCHALFGVEWNCFFGGGCLGLHC